MESVRKRLTYANVMSSLAVFLVVAGGSALAAGTLGKNTVGTKQLKKNAVTAAKIKNGAVTGAKIGAGAVGASNINTTGLTVPNALHANASDSATTAKAADTAKTADTAKAANTANTATSATVANAAFSVNSANDILSFNGTNNQPTTVATLNLPAGNYFLLGKVQVNNNSAALVSANCALSVGGTVIDNGFESIRVEAEGKADRAYLVMSGVASLPTAEAATINCKVTTTEGNWLNRTLSAVQVRALG
jgi:hypothetical protein